jgi:hypothetical protein
MHFTCITYYNEEAKEDSEDIASVFYDCQMATE